MELKIYRYKTPRKEFIQHWGIIVTFLFLCTIAPAIIFYFIRKIDKLATILISIFSFVFSILIFVILYYYFNFNRASMNSDEIISIPAKSNKAKLNTHYTPDGMFFCYRFSISNIRRAYIIRGKTEIEEAKKLVKIDIPLSKLGWVIVENKTICFEFITPLVKDSSKRRNYPKNEMIEKVYLPITEPEKMLEDIEKLKQTTHVRPVGE